MKDIFLKEGRNVHNFHPRPPCIIVPIATAAHSPNHGEAPSLKTRLRTALALSHSLNLV